MNRQNGFTIKNCDHFTIFAEGECSEQLNTETCTRYVTLRKRYKSEHPTLLIVYPKVGKVHFFSGHAALLYMEHMQISRNAREITKEYDETRKKLALRNGSVSCVYESGLTYDSFGFMKKYEITSYLFDAFEQYISGKESLDSYMKKANFVNNVLSVTLALFNGKDSI